MAGTVGKLGRHWSKGGWSSGSTVELEPNVPILLPNDRIVGSEGFSVKSVLGMMSKRALIATLMVLVCCGVVAYGQTEVRFGYWNVSDSYDQLVRSLIDEFNASQTEIVLVAEPITGNVRDQVIVRMASGVAPDITWWAGNWYPEMIESGGFLDLRPYIDRFMAEDIEDFFQPLLEGMTWRGGLYGLPLDANPFALYYNQNAFDQAGIAYPDDTWTWERVAEEARKLTVTGGDRVERHGVVGLLERSYSPTYALIWSNGGEIYDRFESPTEATVTAESVIDSIQWAADLRWVHGVTPTPEEYAAAWADARFMAGQAAMLFWHRGVVDPLRSGADFDWDVATMPSGIQGKSTFVATAGWSILSSSRNPDAAFKALQYFASRETMDRFTQDRGIPVRASLVTRFLNPMSPPMNDRVFIDSLAFGRTTPVLDLYMGDLNATFQNAVAQVYNGTQPAASAMEVVKPLLDAILRR